MTTTKATEKKIENTKTTKSKETIKSNNSNNTAKYLIISCFVVLVLMICACIAFFSFVSIGSFAAIGAVVGGVSDAIETEVGTQMKEVCNADTDNLRAIYNNNFSSKYKGETSFPEFRNFYKENKDILAGCEGDISGVGFEDMLSGEKTFSYLTDENGSTIDVEYNKDGKRVKISIEKTDSKWLINKLEVK